MAHSVAIGWVTEETMVQHSQLWTSVPASTEALPDLVRHLKTATHATNSLVQQHDIGRPRDVLKRTWQFLVLQNPPSSSASSEIAAKQREAKRQRQAITTTTTPITPKTEPKTRKQGGHDPQIASPTTSTLSQADHHRYLSLQRLAARSQQQESELVTLHKKVTQDIRNFHRWVEHVLNSTSNRWHHTLRSLAQQKGNLHQDRLKRIEHDQFSQIASVKIGPSASETATIAPNNNTGVGFSHTATLLQIGRCEHVDPTKVDSLLPLTIDATQMHLTKEPVPAVWEDPYSIALAVKHNVHAVICASSLLSLIDNASPTYRAHFFVPCHVMQACHQPADKWCKIAFFDKPLRGTFEGQIHKEDCANAVLKAIATHTLSSSQFCLTNKWTAEFQELEAMLPTVRIRRTEHDPPVLLSSLSRPNQNVCSGLSYDVWVLGHVRLLVRSRMHAYSSDANGSLRFVHLCVVPQRVHDTATEVLDLSRSLRAFVRACISHSPHIMLANLNTQSCELTSCGTVSREQLAKDSPHPLEPCVANKLPQCLNSASVVLEHAFGLEAGEYLLTHTHREETVKILKQNKPQESAQRTPLRSALMAVASRGKFTAKRPLRCKRRTESENQIVFTFPPNST